VRAAVLTGIGKVVVDNREDPVPRPGWVVVRVESASICGTDVYQFDGRIDTAFPRVPGHDFAGKVDAVGDGVDPGIVGRSFAVKPSLPCEACQECLSGHPADCRRKKLMGLWSDGCMTEFVAVPQVNLVPLPDGVQPWQASLLEPFAVGLNTVGRLSIALGETAVVLGQGPIGLAVTRLTALSGASRVVVTDVREAPFAASRSYGATDCIDVTRVDLAESVAELTGGVGADVVIETSGSPSSSAAMLDLVRKEGRIAHIGWANDLPPLPVIPIMSKTLTVYGVGGNGGRGQYERTLELIRAGRVVLDPLVTHRFGLDDAAKAFSTAASKSGGAIKVLLVP
jgi:2-desacetyl-2-hydroxyethyl bacteriochlorophyllide A dehydrogenase